MTSVQEASYQGFRGKRLALVESMLHSVFYDEIAAARRHGLRVHLLIKDREWYAADEKAWQGHPLTQVDELTFADTHSAEAVRRALTDAHGRPRVDGITTFSDYHTEVAAQVAEELGLPGPGATAIATANHKPSLRAALGDSRYNIPYALVTHPGELAGAAARIGYPMVLKPPHEAISYGVVRVDDPAELAAAYDQVAAIRHSLRGQPRPGHVLMERYVDAPEVSVESLTVEGRTHVYGITAKYLCPPPTFLEAAHSFPAALGPGVRAEVEQAVAEVLELIGYRQGPCHTEVKITAQGPKIVEVNPRLPAGCLTTMVRDVCGSNPHLDAKLLAVGGRPALPTGRRHGGAAVVMLYPPPGPAVLDAVDGVADAERLPGVTVSLFARPGEHLWHRIDNSGRVGLVYATADTAQAALDTATGAAALVRIKVASDEAALPPDAAGPAFPAIDDTDGSRQPR
ncbi:ATP-grasp domain-containing protein [Streptomyces sp. NPDC046197]|uniref:ATP-grasp domain-containing protein n=1 Tax=Streptomyces sp. NPDC046197 TaxID=3154337 RepID=UPI0033D5C110